MLYYKHANALIALMPQGGQRFELLVAAVKLGDSVLADPSEYDAALLPITAAMHTVIGRCCCHPVVGGSLAHQRPATGPPAMSIPLKRPRDDDADAHTTAAPPTVVPTTVVPTTAGSTTAGPTTAGSTTAGTPTEAPPTAGSTTEAPLTKHAPSEAEVQAARREALDARILELQKERFSISSKTF